LAFNPFLGGKRVCLGKTFAETVLKFTLPLFWHHFDIEFATEEHKTVRPHLEILAMSTPVVPVHFITKNKDAEKAMFDKQEEAKRAEEEAARKKMEEERKAMEEDEDDEDDEDDVPEHEEL